MKKYCSSISIFSVLLLNLFLLTAAGTAQTVLIDEYFDDGNLDGVPKWSGDSNHFTITDDAGNYRLQLSAPEAGLSYLGTPSPTVYGTWEFFLRFEFSTLSGSNNLTVFLTADRPELAGAVSGYALVAGETGSEDRFELVRFEDGTVTETILTGTTNINNGGDYQVKVEHRSDGEWELSVSEGYGSTPVSEATGFDKIHTSSGYFGIVPQYTSTRTDKFFFDDITVTKSPIEVTGIEIISNSELQILFTEEPNPTSVGVSDFSISNGVGSPDDVTVQGNRVVLLFDTPLTGDDYSLRIDNIQDQFGTAIPANTAVMFSLFDLLEEDDIIINEFIYDEPSGLTEYVEIKNSSVKRFNMKGWMLGDSNSLSLISEEPLILEPQEYLVISGDTLILSSVFGDGPFHSMSSFPSLNNSGDAIRIKTAAGITVDSLFYTSDWGGDGIALERRSAGAPSHLIENWGESLNSLGGTPGRANEITADEEPPEFSDFKIIDRRNLYLFFNERLRTVSATSLSNYSLNGGAEIISAHYLEPNTVQLKLEPGLQNGISYELDLEGVEDIFGNSLSAADTLFTFYEISNAAPGDIIINEIMFDPLADSEDGQPDQGEYIELLNTREVALSLEGFRLHDAQDENGKVRSLLPVSTDSRWIHPNGIMLIYADTVNTFRQSKTAVYFGMEEYDPAATLRIEGGSLGLSSTGDAIFLADSTGMTIDSVYYHESWHNPNIHDTRGISLERIHPQGASNAPSNWSSSAGPMGGTPGAENSIYQVPESSPAENGITFTPNPFSPDEDGFEDNLFINYKLDRSDYLLNVKIFDRYGRLVCRLTDGQPAGLEGSLIWDGRTDEGHKNRIGIYIVLLEAYNSTEGINRIFKEVVVLARQF